MTFLSPLWLLVALAGIVIVWLHLQRRTQRLHEVSSLHLWRKVAGEIPPQTPKQPPPITPLLFLQLLFTLLLALALAQPILGLLSGQAHTVYVLDASGSMQARDPRPSRLEAARAQILQEADASGGRVSLVVVNSAPYVAAARQNGADARALIEGITGSDGPANWLEAIPLLQALQQGGEDTRVVVYTDPQGLQAASQLSQKVAEERLETRVLGSAQDNIGFYDLDPQPSEKTPGLWRLEGRVANFSTAAREVQLEALFHSPDGSVSPLAQTRLSLNPEYGSFFRLEVTVASAGTVELRLPGDILDSDNRAFLNLYTQAPRLRVLYLGAGNPPLQKALLSVPGLEVFTAKELPADSSTFSLVIADGVSLPRHPQTNTLWVATNPVPGGASLPLLADPFPSGWQRQHPLSQSLDWSEVLLNRALELPRLPGAEVLLEAGGKPLIQARTTPYGREVAVAFGLQDSNWSIKASFPTFLINLLRWAEPRLEGSTACTVGRPCALEPKRLGGQWQLLDPAGRPVPLPVAFLASEAQDPNLGRWLPRELEQSFRPQRGGIYTLVSDGVRYPIAVNGFSPRESDLRAKTEGAAKPPAPYRSFTQLWLWLMLLAMVVLLLEGLWAGRGEGFLQWGNLTRRNPLAFRRRWMLGLQLTAVVLLAIALLNPRVPLPLQQSERVVVADRPEYFVGSAKERLEAYLNQSDRPRVWLGDPPSLEAQPPPNPVPGSSLAASLSLAAGLLSPNASGRMTVVADGTQTRGAIVDAIAGLKARGIPVDVIPVGGLPAGEVMVEQLNLPRILHAGDTFLLQGVVYADQAAPVQIQILRNRQPWARQSVNLLPGRNRIEVPLNENKAGSYVYTLEVSAPQDTFTQNNTANIAATVLPAARVGIFPSDPQQAEVFARALRVQGLDARVLAPEQFPRSQDEIAPLDVVVLMNLPVVELPAERQTLLEGWVKDSGGGLVILGGDKSFGPGGYYQTALDRLSPLSSRVPREAPKVAMLFVLDKSGSMNQPAGQARRIDIAKEATTNALDLLHPESLAGVVGFDVKAQVAVPMQSVRDKAGFARRLETLEPSGGTSIYPALELALQTLQNVDAPARHIVLMTDGLSTPGDFQGAVERIRAADITLSTVAVGESARLDLMQNIARWGGGVAHVVTDWQTLPAILAQEALLQSKTTVKQQPFTPVWRDRSVPWLEGFPTSMPPLGAYTQTTAKPEALVHLLGPGGDPILASWPYGLGQVAAFSSQGSGPWSAAWVRSAQFPRWWSQVVHGLLPTAARSGLNLALERRGSEVQLIVEALTPKGETWPGLNLQATVTAPGGLKSVFDFAALEPGRYEARFTVTELGSHSVEVSALEPLVPLQNRPFTLSTSIPPLPQPVQQSFALPYPPRYGFNAQGLETLSALAETTGGRVLLGGEPLEFPAALKWSRWAIWPLLAALSLLLFLAALTLRYQPEVRWLRRRVGSSPSASRT